MKKILNKCLAAIVMVLAGSLGGCNKGAVYSFPRKPYRSNPYSSPATKPKPRSRAFGIYAGLPELLALRYVHGWDKPCGVQANIGPIFGSADLRVNRKNFGRNTQGYGLIGVTALMPWVKDIVEEEPGSPTYCLEFGVGFEKGKKDGLAVGAEFALVIPLEEQKQEEESGTMGFRFGVSLVKRY